MGWHRVQICASTAGGNIACRLCLKRVKISGTPTHLAFECLSKFILVLPGMGRVGRREGGGKGFMVVQRISTSVALFSTVITPSGRPLSHR